MEGRGFQPREEARHEALVRFDDRRVAFMVVAPQRLLVQDLSDVVRRDLDAWCLDDGDAVVA